MTSSLGGWWWVAIGLMALVAAALLTSFIIRMLNPPVEPTVEERGVLTAIQVEVVNGSGVAGAGRMTMRFLRERGFDVVELSTLPSKSSKSMIIDRVGDRISALKVAKVLGIADTLVVSDIDSMRFVRSSVVLGTDLHQLDPFTH